MGVMGIRPKYIQLVIEISAISILFSYIKVRQI